jgi:ADP-ribose pyrophosphatase YjhB (NUDIX family)
MFCLVFVVDEWSGKVKTQTEETADARFFALDKLPEIPKLYRETLADLQAYQKNGHFILK